jgi:tripartite-type tricarboxylate transporter receptor subunit TctC
MLVRRRPSPAQHRRRPSEGAGDHRQDPFAVTLPNVPTLAESGVPGYEAVSWLGFMAPAGTPAPIVQKLNAEIGKLASRPDIKEAWARQSVESSVMSAAGYDKFLRSEVEKWAEVVKVSGAKFE